MNILDLIGALLVLAGSVLALTAAIGVVRFPDSLSRMHAASKPQVLGLLLVLGMLSALNRPHEIEVHIKGALNNGLTREEICEVFLQVAIYCGVPQAMECFRSARKVLDEVEA